MMELLTNIVDRVKELGRHNRIMYQAGPVIGFLVYISSLCAFGEQFHENSSNFMIKIPSIRANDMPINEFVDQLESKWRDVSSDKSVGIVILKSNEYLKRGFSSQITLNMVDMPLIEIVEIVGEIGGFHMSIKENQILLKSVDTTILHDNCTATKFIKISPIVKESLLFSDNEYPEKHLRETLKEQGVRLDDSAELYITSDPYLGVFICAKKKEVDLTQSLITLYERGYMPVKLKK